MVLKPYVYALNAFYLIVFEYVPELGYREINGIIVIGKDCVGSKLFISLFLIFSFCYDYNHDGMLKGVLMIFLTCITALAMAFIITLFRITASIPFYGMKDFKLIHTILSLLIYFGSSLGLYSILTYLSYKKRRQ